MGCSSSQETRGARTPRSAQRLNISMPVDPPGAVPAPAKDAQGAPLKYQQYDLTSRDLQVALGYAAQYLHSKNHDTLIITVGGAVNTLFLRSRSTTHDIDFFGEQLSGRQLELVRAAGRYAVEKSSVPLSVDWLNNATERMPGAVENIRHLVRKAKEQNDIVFQAPGLTALAAPWNYAFVKKVSRMAQGTSRPYDAKDAAAYLHQYIRRHGGRAVDLGAICEWGRLYRAAVPSMMLEQVNQSYVKSYGKNGIILPSDEQGSRGERPSNRQRR